MWFYHSLLDVAVRSFQTILVIFVKPYELLRLLNNYTNFNVTTQEFILHLSNNELKFSNSKISKSTLLPLSFILENTRLYFSFAL